MFLEILTPEKRLFDGEVRLVQAPGTRGSFEVLKNHAPMITTLRKGLLRIVTDEDIETSFEIEGGILEVKKNRITVLAE